MNLHSNLRYPFLKYVIEEFSGVFFENDFTSLNRLVVLYHNRHSFGLKPNDAHGFLDSYEQGLSVSDWFYCWFWGRRRQRIRQVKHRTAFAIRHNRVIFERLLLRKDYASPEAANEAIISISNWLQTLSPGVAADDLLDLEGWKRELLLLNQKIGKPETVTKKVSRTHLSERFQEQFTDGDDAERLLKFNRLKRILLTERWIVPIGGTDTYRYCKQAKGGRLYIAALYYVLMEKGHIRMTTDAPQIAASFNSWLVHDFEHSSFVKAFQAEELSQFDGRDGNPRTKYLKEVRLLLRDL